jgi:hypothetical protein
MVHIKGTVERDPRSFLTRQSHHGQNIQILFFKISNLFKFVELFEVEF